MKTDMSDKINKWRLDRIDCPFCDNRLDGIDYYDDESVSSDTCVICDSCDARFSMSKNIEIVRKAEFKINNVISEPSDKIGLPIVFEDETPNIGLFLNASGVIGKLADQIKFHDYEVKAFGDTTDPFVMSIDLERYFEAGDKYIVIGNSTFSTQIVQDIIHDFDDTLKPGISVDVTFQNYVDSDKPVKILKIDGKVIDDYYLLAPRMDS